MILADNADNGVLMGISPIRTPIFYDSTSSPLVFSRAAAKR